jgi:MoaA/NifB/PqqE/SkfB family radical SAM enzyme
MHSTGVSSSASTPEPLSFPARWRKRLARAAIATGFDELDYGLRYPDVRAAVESGGFACGREHYDAYGRAEGRTYRLAWLAGLRRLARLTQLVVPATDSWSGVTLCWCWRRAPHADAELTVTVYELHAFGVRRLARKAVRLGQRDDREPLTVYWPPIAGSAGRRFLLVIRARHAVVEPGAADALVYSAPQSPLPFPKAILFSPVTQCNLNCIHCVSKHTRTRFAELDEAAWDEIAAAAGCGRLEHLRSDYSGDIFFSDWRHRNWFERMRGLDIELVIDTHANDLTPDVIERVMQSKVIWINFSLDSMDPADYPRIRKGARPLAEVLDVVRSFMAARNARRPLMTTILSFVLMKRNLDSIPAAIDFAAEVGVTGIWCNHLHAHSGGMAEESLMLQPRRYEAAYRAFLALAKEKKVSLSMPAPVRVAGPVRGHTPCDYPWRSITVLGDGQLMACNVPGTNVGHLRDGSLADLWNGPVLREFRARVNSDNPPDACSVCPMRRVEGNFASYVPGLPEHARRDFERRCLAALGTK